MQSSDSAAGVMVRPFEPADISGAYALANSFGFPQRMEDLQWFCALSRGLVAMKDGVLVGSLLCWEYGGSVGSVGAVVVDRKLQGFGIGRRLMEACLAALSDRSIILYATPAGRPLYEKLGFIAHGTLTQHQGIVRAAVPSPQLSGARIVPLTRDLAESSVRLAEQGSGLQRTELFNSLLAISEGAVLLEDGVPSGFSLFRRYGGGWAIGPVVASNEESARALIAYWLSRKAGEFVRVDITVQAGESLHLWLDSVGLEAASVATPMVRGRWPTGHPSVRQFAITTQATG